MSKPGVLLRRLCKKLGVRLTVKRNGKRVYKSVAVLKAQCKSKVKKKKKKVKRKRKFVKRRFGVKRKRNFGKKSVDIKNFAKRNKIPLGVAATILSSVGLGYYIKNRKKNKSSKPEDEVDCTQFVTKRGCPVGCEWYEDECLNPATKKILTDSLDGIPVKRTIYTIGEVHGTNHSHYILDELFKYLESTNSKDPYIFTEYGMILPKTEGFSVSEYTDYLTKKFGSWFLTNRVIQINKELHNTAMKLSKAHFIVAYTKNGIKMLIAENKENFKDKTISSYKEIFKNKPFVSALDEINKRGYEYQFNTNAKKIGDKVEVNNGRDEYYKGTIVNSFPNFIYTIAFDIGEIHNFKEFRIKSLEVRSYEDLNRVLNLRPTNLLKTFNISEQNSLYKGIEQAFEVLKKNTKGFYNKQIIHDFKIYKQAFNSLMENYEKFLEFSKLLKSKMGKDYENFNKLQYYYNTSGPGSWVQDEMNRIASNYVEFRKFKPIVTNLILSSIEFTKIFPKCFLHAIKVRDEYLKRKIDEKNKSVDKNIPFIVYLGVNHFVNYDFSKDYEEINLIGKIQSIIQPDNKHLFPLTEPKYYKYRKGYRNLLKDKGIALSTIKLDKAAPGLEDWVEKMRLENKGNYSYSFGKKKRKRKVKRKRKRKSKRKRKVKRKRKKVKRKRKKK
jgi:hypothetical protein